MRRSPSLVSRLLPVLLVTSLPAACGGGAMQTGDDDDGVMLVRPTLDSVAPTELALGDDVKVIGSDFPDPADASLSLHLAGTYTDEDGQTHDFDGEVPLTVQNPSVASFRFESIFFLPSGDKVGTWHGEGSLVVRAGDDEAGGVESATVPLDLRVAPSILIERLRAVRAGCADVTMATNASTPIEMGVKAIGLGEASPGAPWQWQIGFLSPNVTVRYVADDAFDFWPPTDDLLGDSVAAMAPDGENTMAFATDQGSSLYLEPDAHETVAQISPPVTIGQQEHYQVAIQRIMTGAVDLEGNSYANFVVQVFTADGRSLRRTVQMQVWKPFEIGLWSGDERLVRRFEPHATSACIPGGTLGGELGYTEGESVTKSRSINIRWDSGASSSLGFNAGNLNVFQVTGQEGWSQSFGVDVSESVSSEEHKSLNLSIHLLPYYYGMSYRQLEQLERSVDVTYHNVCGASGVIGQATLTNWNFGFDVAQAPDCPPPTNLPPAATF